MSSNFFLTEVFEPDPPLERDVHDPASAPPLAAATISAYLRDSRPGGRYQDTPIPAPTYDNDTAVRSGQHPRWIPEEGETLADLEQRLRAWFASRPVRGRSRTAPPTTRVEDCLTVLLDDPDRERNLTELAAAAGIPAGTIRSTVRTLLERRWVAVRPGRARSASSN